MRLKHLLAAVASFVIGASASFAADWTPPGPIKLMIAFAAGGGADTQARMIASQIEADTGWKIIPEQVTGKGGVNALVELSKAPNDGSTIAMVVTESTGYNLVAARGAGLSPDNFAGLTTTAGFQMGIVSKSDQGWSSFEEMISAAKNGKEIRFGVMSPKLADIAFLLGEAQGVEFNIISVQGGKAVMDGVMAGDMDVGFMAGIQGKGVASGDLLNLASALSTPLQQTPDAPTLADLGVPHNADGYFLFAAPAGLPDDAREALTAALVKATNEGDASAMITRAFGGVVNITGEDLDALMAEQFTDAGDLMDAVN